MSPLRKVFNGLTAAALLAGVIGLGASSLTNKAKAQTIGAGNQNSFNLSAEGDGMWIEVDDNSLPLTSSVSASPYSAAAAVNSVGQSSALAGFPYLGAFISSLPGLVNGLGAGQLPPVPALPGYIQTSYPTNNTADQSNGPYVLKASSSQFSSSASAGFGITSASGGQPQISSSASVAANDDGSVSVTASAGADLFNLGPLDLGNFSTTETMTEQGSKAPVLTGSQTIGTATVAGFKIGFDNTGFTILGDNLPILGTLKTITTLVNQILSAAGLSITVLPEVTTDVPGTNILQSFTSGALQVQETKVIPIEGKVTLTYIFGRVTLLATDTTVAAPTGPTGPVSTPGTIGTGTGTGTPSTSGSSLGAIPVPTSSGASSLPSSSGAASPTLASPPGATQIPSSTPQSNPTPSHSIALIGPSAESFYLILVLAALAALGGSQALRLLGVRLHMQQNPIRLPRRT